MNRSYAVSSVDEDQVPVLMAILAMVVAIVALLLTILDLNVPGRSLLAVLSLLTVPGIPLAMALPIPRLMVQFVLGVALSLAIVLLISTIQLESGTWSPLVTQTALIVIGLPATAFAARSFSVR